MNEAETRAEYIDPALKFVGWGVVEGSRILREYPITLGRLQVGGVRSKPDIADYVLVYKNHKLAVVEAKRWDLPYMDRLFMASIFTVSVESKQKLQSIRKILRVNSSSPAFLGSDQIPKSLCSLVLFVFWLFGWGLLESD